EYCRDGCEYLIREDGGLDARHQGANVAACDARCLQLSPPRKSVAADQRVALLPALVPALGVMLDVAFGQLGERARAALGPLLGRWVLAPGDGKHGLRRQRAGVGEPDRTDVAEMEPARAAVVGVDRLPGSGTGGLHPDREPTLMRVPNEVGCGPW